MLNVAPPWGLGAQRQAPVIRRLISPSQVGDADFFRRNHREVSFRNPKCWHLMVWKHMYIYIYILKGLRPLPPTPRPLEAGKCLTLLSEATRKALGKRPECCKSLRRRRRGAFEARLLPPECSNSLWQGRREAFGGRQVPNVAFWSH